MTGELRIFLVAGEHSGDALGGKLMAALKARTGSKVTFAGVGGEEMAHEGLVSAFPLSDVAVMGPVQILKRLPTILRRVRQAVEAAIAFKPDVVVIIDSPEFTHPIAKRIRKRMPEVPIVDYVSPSVWAWRPGRAKRMRAYVDHVLALLPFEPDAHRRLGGPQCTYVGHPLIERLDEITTADGEALASRLGLSRDRPVLAVFPGSRRSEIHHLLKPFGETIATLAQSGRLFHVVIPAVKHLKAEILSGSSSWAVKPFVVDGAEDKYAAMRLADAALAVSGTVTLELALARTPTVVAYKADRVMQVVRFLIKVPSVVLANLVIGRNVYPEFLQEACTPDALSAALLPLLSDTEVRRQQIAALPLAAQNLALASGTPSGAAAEVVLAVAADYAAGKSRLGGPT